MNKSSGITKKSEAKKKVRIKVRIGKGSCSICD